MALRHLIVKTTYQIIFFQRHNKLFDWTEIEDPMWTRDKNHLTRRANPLNRASAPPYEQPLSRADKSKAKQNLQQKHQINFIRLFKTFSCNRLKKMNQKFELF